jgi:hypothetical protein
MRHAFAFQAKHGSCIFGKEKNGIYCSQALSFIAFATQGVSKQLGATFVANCVTTQ